jgi:uncharacterized protein (TIGR01777 family)
MRILISGSHGLIGSALTARLKADGHTVIRLVRTKPIDTEGAVAWQPEEGWIDLGAAGAIDAVIHLAGANIASGRWNPARKKLIHNSRVKSTRLLAGAVAALAQPPGVFISASAVGYYGDGGDRQLSEEAPSGRGFLAEVCRGWEAACRPVTEAGVRTVMLRIGMVLAASGGALERMLTPFRLGLGGRLGSGRQFVSWISIDDVLGAVVHVLSERSLAGPVNLVAPEPVTNAVFARTLARQLGRPAVLPVPSLVLKIMYGEMAEALILSSVRAIPARLLQSDYRFRHGQLSQALQDIIT